MIKEKPIATLKVVGIPQMRDTARTAICNWLRLQIDVIMKDNNLADVYTAKYMGASFIPIEGKQPTKKK